MKIKPEELLACAESMTPEQRARFCELIDPAHPDAVEAEIDANVNPFLELGVQGPMPGSVEDVELFAYYHRARPPHGLFRPPSPELLAQFLYNQMTHKELVVAAPKGLDVDAMAVMETVVMNKQDLIEQDRWMKARERWEQYFGEAQIPAIRQPDPAVVLEAIEGMIYDKETKGANPPRCGCGCGYVVGCGKGHKT